MVGRKNWIARSASNQAIQAGNEITFEEIRLAGGWVELEVEEASKIFSADERMANEKVCCTRF
jgi:hypothetical protein